MFEQAADVTKAANYISYLRLAGPSVSSDNLVLPSSVPSRWRKCIKISSRVSLFFPPILYVFLGLHWSSSREGKEAVSATMTNAIFNGKPLYILNISENLIISLSSTRIIHLIHSYDFILNKCINAEKNTTQATKRYCLSRSHKYHQWQQRKLIFFTGNRHQKNFQAAFPLVDVDKN